jgi:predicted transcriptional regulator
MSSKEIAMDVIRKLPDEATLMEIAQELLFIAGIRPGSEELDRSEGVTPEEVLKRIPTWAGPTMEISGPPAHCATICEKRRRPFVAPVPRKRHIPFVHSMTPMGTPFVVATPLSAIAPPVPATCAPPGRGSNALGWTCRTKRCRSMIMSFPELVRFKKCTLSLTDTFLLVLSAARVNQWDHDACYKPYAIFDGQKWLLWYNGRHDALEQIGVVFHPGEDLGF